MKSSQSQLKQAIKKTTKFMLMVEVNSSERVPEWYEQMALSSSHDGLNNSTYETLLAKLKNCLNKEYGSSATNFILS